MEISYKKIIGILIILVLLALLIYYASTNISDFKQLKIENPWYIFPIAILFLLLSLTNGLVIKYFTEPFNIKLKAKEWFGLSIITSFYNMITPFRGGAIAKAAYLKKKHKLAYTDFLATFSGVYVITFLVASFFGLFSFSLLYLYQGIFNVIVLLVFSAVFFPLLFIVLFSPYIPPVKHKHLNKIIQVINGWHTIRRNRKIIAEISIITLIQLILSLISTILSFRVFGINIGVIESAFLVSIGSLAMLVSITPGSLGIAEAIAVFSALIIGITPAQSLTVAILGRVISVAIIFILGPVFSFILIKHRPRKISYKIRR
ncbi:flippase-like domain-containing protein [Candidatus Pacearchaeota archaeon]|nr:flippase-like domain-containing protein [Candidatus Pacearchaeota archaeon]